MAGGPRSKIPLARQLSVGAVVDAIIHGGPVSRVAISKATGLSKQTVSEVVRELEAEGWLRPTGQTSGCIGRTATTYEICPDAAFILGVDLGGAKIHAAIANLACHVVIEESEATAPAGGLTVVQQIANLASRLAGDAGIASDKIRLAAIGSPGVVDHASGSIRLAPNIPGFETLDVVGALRDALGTEVIVENDVNMAAIGEQWLGKARGKSTFAFLALGTGFGMGVLSDGKLMRGARGAAGEIAYLPIGGDPFDAATREHGTLETAVGAAGILRRYRAAGGASAESVRDIFDAMAAGDAVARATIEETARLIALTTLTVATLLDPELIVLGGSIGARLELVERVRALLAGCMPNPVLVEASALGNRAGIIGALAFAINNIHNSLFGPAGLPEALALPALPELRGLAVSA
jgi:predicted NBD/HSP70 family sugar kinase